MLVAGGVLAAALAGVVAGCGGGGGAYGGPGGGGGGGGGGGAPTPSPGPVVHINMFGGGNGSINSPPFGTVSGYTQQAHAQVMAFNPGEMITITNNDTVAHTVNVAASYPTPGPQSTAQNLNGNVIGPGFQSGVIPPGNTIGPFQVTNTVGNLFIFCGIHFSQQVPYMQDGIIVQVGATPGPEATISSGGGGGCGGYGC